MKRISWEQILRVMFPLYLLWLLRITVFRPGFSFAGLGQNGVISATPFREYYYWVKQGRYGIASYLFFGNIGVFLPFGAYVAWRKQGWKLWQMVLAGFGWSLLIEIGQYLLGTGVTDAADLVLNTLGVLIGAVLLGWWRSSV